MSTPLDKIWILDLTEDPVTGDLVMDLPPELLASQGWKIGDTLIWDLDKDSEAVVLRKQESP